MANPVPPVPRKELSTAEAIAELAQQLKPKTQLELAGLTPEQEAKLMAVPTAKKWRHVECKSEETGATFTALVIESAKHPSGRITQLLNYKHPKGVCTYESHGGLVPNGYQILNSGPGMPQNDGEGLLRHEFVIHYLQWRWVEFWQKDLKRYVGKELMPFLCVKPEGFAVPWEEGKTRAFIGLDE